MLTTKKMRKLDLYWMSNRDWIDFTDYGVILRPDAPPEAQKSYAHYLEQTKGDESPDESSDK